MNSRERVHLALNHQEPGRIPLDLGGSVVTGIHASTVYHSRQALKLDAPGTPVKVIEPFQMLGRDQTGYDRGVGGGFRAVELNL